MEDVGKAEFIEGEIEGKLVSNKVKPSHIAHILMDVLPINQQTMSSIVSELYFYLILCLKQYPESFILIFRPLMLLYVDCEYGCIAYLVVCAIDLFAWNPVSAPV